MNLKLDKYIQELGFSISGACELFLLENYCVKGEFQSYKEELFFVVVMIAGGASLFITAIWQGIAIRDEIKRDEADDSGAGVIGTGVVGVGLVKAEQQNDAPVTELSSVWVGVGVVATTTYTGMDVANVYMESSFLTTLSISLLPVVLVLWTLSSFAQPRRRDSKTILFLRLHFFIHSRQ